MITPLNLVDRLREVPNLIIKMTEQGVYVLKAYDGTGVVPIGELCLEGSQKFYEHHKYATDVGNRNVNLHLYPYLTQDEDKAMRVGMIREKVLDILLKEYGGKRQPFRDALRDPEFKSSLDDATERTAQLILAS